MRHIIIIAIISLLPLFADEDFLKGVRAEDLMVERIEPPPDSILEEVTNLGFPDYWYGKSLHSCYSLDSAFIAEARTEKPGGKVMGIWVMDIKRKTEKKIVDGIAYELKWSPSGKFLAFERMVPCKELYHGRQVYQDGGRWIYDVEANHIDSLPMASYEEWSPTGDCLAGEDYSENGDWIIKIYDAKTKKITVLDQFLFFEPMNYSWSPNGEMLVYVIAQKASGHGECSPLESDVYVINRDGSGKTQLTHTPQPEILVKWLPDGQTIVVERFKEMPDAITGGGEKEVVVLKLKKKERK
ncbi:MAG: hypothetical protein ABIL39_00380 [candidate division WOR-3 bacterium]